MKLEEAKAGIGRKVIYTPFEGSNQKEEGVITSTNEYYVFVRYGNIMSIMATRAKDLEFIWGNEK